MRPDPDLPVDDQEVHRWERQPAETVRAYLAFAHYRDLGPLRTLRRAAALMYHPDAAKVSVDDSVQFVTEAQLCQMKTWSRSNEWVDRAGEWDLHLDAISRAEQEQHAKTMRNSYRIVAGNLRARVASSIVAWTNETPTRVLTPTEAARALEVAQKIEAWSVDQPSEVRAGGAEREPDAEDLVELGRGIVTELRLVQGGATDA